MTVPVLCLPRLHMTIRGYEDGCRMMSLDDVATNQYAKDKRTGMIMVDKALTKLSGRPLP